MVNYIYVDYNKRKYRLKVEIILLTDVIERFKVSNKTQTITLQSNRPLLRHKGLKKRFPNWKVIEGTIHNPNNIDNIITELMRLNE